MKKRNLILAVLALAFVLVLSVASCTRDPAEETDDGSLPEFIATVPPEDIDFGVDPE